MLTPQHKMQRMSLALQHLNRYHDEGHDMLARIVTVMSLWFTITSPRQSVRQCSGNIQREPPGSDSSPKNFMLLVVRDL
jgi:hypothetical protein